MSKWDQPKDIHPLDLGMGPKDIAEYLPAMDEIPGEFKKFKGKWQDICDDIFFCGIRIKNVTMKDGIDKQKAVNHMYSVLSSWESDHNHKIAGVAYLMSLWFDKFEYETVKNIGDGGEP